MRNLFLLGLLLCAVAVASFAQARIFNWTAANDESLQMDPADYHTGRVYRPAPGGGNIHVDIDAHEPVTIAMTWADEWNAALQTNPMQHPEVFANLSFRCVQEHVMKTTYECHLPSDRPMVLTIHDERTPNRAILSGIGAIINHGAKQFVSPNDIHIQYYSWNCVEYCIQPELQWFRLIKEKYEVTQTPKVYSLLTPDHDGQELSVKIKAPVPMTIAVIPSKLADQVYDKTQPLSAALSQTSCKQRGVQSLTFECKFNLADGPQSIMILPDTSFNGRKKAEIELQTVKCLANCNIQNH
jgi:hypothetical protein